MTLKDIKQFQEIFDKKFKGNIEFYEEITDDITPLEHLIVCMLGEFGEFSNLVKKVKRGDFSLDEIREQMNEEFIDIFIYLVKITNQLNIDIEKEYLIKMKKNEKKFENFLK